METVVTSVRLSKTRFKQLKDNAKSIDVSRNEYIDLALEEYARKHENEKWKKQVKKEAALLKKDPEYTKLIAEFNAIEGEDLPDEPNNGWWVK